MKIAKQGKQCQKQHSTVSCALRCCKKIVGFCPQRTWVSKPFVISRLRPATGLLLTVLFPLLQESVWCQCPAAPRRCGAQVLHWRSFLVRNLLPSGMCKLILQIFLESEPYLTSALPDSHRQDVPVPLSFRPI